MRRFGQWLLTNPLNAAMTAFVATLSMWFNLPGGFIAAVILGLITLQKGAKAGLFVLAWIALPGISLLLLGKLSLFDVSLLRCVLVFLFAVVLKTYQSWRLNLELASLMGVVMVLLLHLLVPDLASVWQRLIGQYLQTVTKTMHISSSIQMQQVADGIAPVATGLVGFIVLLGGIIQLMLSRWWQSLIDRPGEFRQEFLQIRMGLTPAVSLALILMMTLFGSSAAKDALAVGLLPFLIAGLSVCHAFSHQYKAMIVAMVLIYLGLFLLPLFAVVVVALMGLVDTWLNFRQRYLSH